MNDHPFLIAGGGIGGLAAALGLARQGRPVRLFEQAAGFEEIGAGLQMSPNGVRALQALGAWDAVEPSCVIPSEIHMRDGLSGALLQRIRLRKPFEDRFGAPYRVCHRADLLAGLVAAARRDFRIELNTGARATIMEDTGEAARLGFADGGFVKGTAVVAADGIRSALRGAVAGDVPATPRGVILYRALMPLNRVPPEIEADCVTLWLCPGAHVVHYAVSSWRNFNVVVAVDGTLPDAGWKTPAHPGEVPKRLAGLCGELALLLAAPAGWMRWPGADLPPLPQWTKGRLALLGDAAHATLPFLAQGAVMALEDAVVMSREVARCHDAGEAFRAYEAQRRGRTARVQEQSRSMARVYHASGLLAAGRNLTLRLSGPSFALGRLEWIYRWTPDNSG
ncbi:FAD-dependent monooxygenase [Aestuariivirga sp.]|uniref:FAD-dependent monooxygenase n=1 Tax=Aestuariivirga sp. TaxID=2650926 RepID=UPI0025BE5584|nr:FAD-dependent monooxygenase [Aestuariivirga sp.]MCA3556212.1 FAD-dependent monooxygenase [Aestuariivirga sp.]